MKRCICAQVLMADEEGNHTTPRVVNGITHRTDGPCHSEVVAFATGPAIPEPIFPSDPGGQDNASA